MRFKRVSSVFLSRDSSATKENKNYKIEAVERDQLLYSILARYERNIFDNDESRQWSSLCKSRLITPSAVTHVHVVCRDIS